jgi:hypothetical protein
MKQILAQTPLYYPHSFASSPFGGDWIRFSYATPVERTEGAFKRLVEGLESLKK